MVAGGRAGGDRGPAKRGPDFWYKIGAPRSGVHLPPLCTRSPSDIAGQPSTHPPIHQLSRVTIANVNVTRRRFRSSADRGGDGSPHRATAGVDLTCARALTHPCSEKKYVRYGRVKNRTDVSVHSSQRSLSHEWRRAARAPTANDKCEPLRAYSLASLFEAA